MISRMSRVEIVGSREAAWRCLERLQESGVMQPEARRVRGLTHAEPPPPDQEEYRQLELGLLEAVDDLISRLPPGPEGEPEAVRRRRDELVQEPTFAVLGRADTLRVSLGTLESRERQLREERDLLDHDLEVLAEIGDLEDHPTAVLLPLLVSHDPRQRRQVVADIEELCAAQGLALQRAAGSFAGGSLDTLAVPQELAGVVHEYVWQRQVPRVVFPEEVAHLPASQMKARMGARRSSLDQAHAEATRQLEAFRDQYRLDLLALADLIEDRRRCLEAMRAVSFTDRAFVLTGWVPTAELPRLAEAVAPLADEGVEVRTLPFDPQSMVPPTRLDNPWWSRPAEVFLSFLPPPRYDGFDPTLVFLFTFPVLFGWMVGDAGYGLLLLAIARLAERRLGHHHPAARDFARVLGLAALCSILFGLLFGEFFGNLGAYLLTGTWHEPVPVWLDRSQEHVEVYLGLSLGIGLVHISFSLLLGLREAWRDLAHREPHARELLAERAALLVALWGAVAMLLGTALPAMGLLAPGATATALVHGGRTAAGLALVVLLWALPGAVKVTAALEELAVLTKTVSYARLMAVGVAGVVFADIANGVAQGAQGAGPARGLLHVAGAVLLHLIAFVLVIWDPMVQALRLHYVEFFASFYRPTGAPFAPLRRADAWRLES